MSRPIKARRVCQLPIVSEFGPAGFRRRCDAVIMTIDEYETIYLIDHEGMSQQECADQMGVARSTAQAIYSAARKKISVCLVEGKGLRIEGGDYEICQGGRRTCCRRRQCERLEVADSSD